VDIKSLNVKLFCDSGSLDDMQEMLATGLVSGFTCNPSLCRRAGVTDYLTFCREAARLCGDLPLSLEVVADEPDEIYRQAYILGAIGDEVFVKVPIVNASGKSNAEIIADLADEDVQVNVTACFTERHVKQAREALSQGNANYLSYISIFAGRIADSGRCPERLVSNASWYVQGTGTQIIWASVREPYNIVQAERCQCQAITIFPEMLRRLDRFGRDLDEFARETSKMFYDDAVAAGYSL
jgi:transaldolase